MRFDEISDRLVSLMNTRSINLVINESYENVMRRRSFQDMFNNEDGSDVKYCFTAPDEDDKSEAKILHAHSHILARQNEVYEKQFSDKWNGSKKIIIDFCSYEAFHVFLEYIYTRFIKSASLDIAQLIELYDLAERYFEPRLKRKVMDDFVPKLESIESFVELIYLNLMAINHKDLSDKIVECMSRLIRDGNSYDFTTNHDSCDIVFCFNDEEHEEAKKLYAHKSILADRSQVFLQDLVGRWKDLQEINIDFCSWKVFNVFLLLIYSRISMTSNHADSLTIIESFQLCDMAERYHERDIQTTAAVGFWLKLPSIDSIEELLDILLMVSDPKHNDLCDRVLEHISAKMTVQNFKEIIRFADEKKHHRLLETAAL